MGPKYKTVYRRIRNMWGWILAALWVVFWYFRLTTHAAGECEGLVGSTGCGLVTGGGILLALVTAPLAFVISHYIARIMVERQERAETERDQQAQHQAQARLEAEQEDQRRLIAEQDAGTRRVMERKIFIQKIGTARDALTAQARESDPARQALAAQQVSTALRDLATRFDLQQMTVLVSGDEAVWMLVRSLVDDLRDSMQFPPEARLLEQALGPMPADASGTPPPASPDPVRSKYRMS